MDAMQSAMQSAMQPARMPPMPIRLLDGSFKRFCMYAPFAEPGRPSQCDCPPGQYEIIHVPVDKLHFIDCRNGCAWGAPCSEGTFVTATESGVNRGHVNIIVCSSGIHDPSNPQKQWLAEVIAKKNQMGHQQQDLQQTAHHGRSSRRAPSPGRRKSPGRRAPSQGRRKSPGRGGRQ